VSKVRQGLWPASTLIFCNYYYISLFDYQVHTNSALGFLHTTLPTKIRTTRFLQRSQLALPPCPCGPLYHHFITFVLYTKTILYSFIIFYCVLLLMFYIPFALWFYSHCFIIRYKYTTFCERYGIPFVRVTLYYFMFRCIGPDDGYLIAETCCPLWRLYVNNIYFVVLTYSYILSSILYSTSGCLP